ncbi:MAG: ABC transporter substrate-binding protein [Methanoregula sp.]|jgi:polar amino acid transport system substrate-binding protein|uniref:ABC transporter substrate-binding protein n=1 Tax=Methanoregula sp. TaxID=2052170 RepID=UPI003D1253FC
MISKTACIVLALTLLIGGCLLTAGCTQSGSTGTAAPTAAGQQNSSSVTKTYIVGVDGAYPPYTYIDKDGTFHGIDVDSARWIAKDKGFNVEFQAIEWDGIIPALQAGKIDMVYSGMTITPERSEQVNFSTPYLTINQTIAIRNDSTLSADDILAGKAIIGAQRGTTGAIWAENNLVGTGKMPADHLKEYDNFPLVITDLMNKNIDASIYDRPSQIAAIEGKPIHIVYEIDTGEQYGIAIRKDDPQLLQTMNEGLADLHADPYWKELLATYQLN